MEDVEKEISHLPSTTNSADKVFALAKVKHKFATSVTRAELAQKARSAKKVQAFTESLKF